MSPDAAGSAEALRAAVAEEDWPAFLSLLRSSWTHLAQAHPADLLAGLERLPPEVLDREPRLRIARSDLGRALHGPGYAPAGAGPEPLPAEMSPADRISVWTSWSAAARAEGRIDEALSLIGSARETLRGLSAFETASLSAILPQILNEWALTFEQDGRWDEALALHVDSSEWAVSIGHRAMAAESTGAVALLTALSGRDVVASAWLGRLPPGGRPPRAVLAEAVLAADALDPGRAHELLATLRPVDTGGLDPLVRALGALGDPRASRSTATAAATALRARSGPMSRGSGDVLHAISALAANPEPLAGTPRTDSLLGRITVATRALTASLRGDDAEARRAIAPLLDQRDSPRALVTALLAASSRSPAALADASAVAHAHGVFAPFALLPPDARRRAAEHLDELGARDAAERLRALPSREERLLPPAQLEVAAAAASGATLGEIAAARGVSVNTVKTQLRQAYRALGVRTRSELAAALVDRPARED